MKALVLGGTRFFGRRLVDKLIDAGHDVTVATRGRTDDPFGDRVARLVIDRDSAQLRDQLGPGEWDVAFDQIGYSSANARALVDALRDRVGHVVFTSSGAVYERTGRPLTEDEFDPTTYAVRIVSREDASYAEGKRLAEALLFQEAPFTVSAMRFTVVTGTDDYTGRLAELVDRVRNGGAIYAERSENLVSFISAEDAARQLQWAGDDRYAGPLNGASELLTFGALLDLIEKHVGRAPVRSATADPDTAVRMDTSSALDTSKARSLGFRFTTNMEDAVAELCA